MAGDDVVIKLQADIRDLTGKLSQVTSQFSTLEKTVRSSSAQINSSLKSISGAATLAKTAFAAIAFGNVTRSTIQLADAMTNMRSRIRLVTDSTEEAAAVQQQLLDVANRTRTDFTAIGELYARLGRSADDLGLSQQRLIAFVETFSQALKVSGASSAEAQSTILQLSQALSSGRLQGAELNAVLEAGGRASQALADGLGVPIGSLKKLGEQGQLTSDVVIRAIESQASVISTEYTSMKVTASDAFTVLQNAIAETIGKMNESTGATDQLSTTVLELANRVKDPAFIEGLKSVAAAVVEIARVSIEAASAVGRLYTNIKTLGGILPENGPGFASKLEFMAGGGKFTPVAPAAPTGSPEASAPAARASGASGGGGGRIQLSELGSSQKAAADTAKQYADTIAELQFQIAQLARSEEEAAFQEALRNNLARAGVALDSQRGQTVSDYTLKIQEATLAAREAAELEAFAADIREQFGDQTRAAAEYQERLNQALAAGKIATEEHAKAIEAVTKTDRTRELEGNWQRIGDEIEGNIADAFYDMATGAETAQEAIGELLKSIGQLIAKQLILQAVQGITNSIFGDGGIGKALAGGKALGGAVHAGSAYRVGESGPEVFVPRVPGSIVPRGKAGGTVVNLQSIVHAAPGTNRAELQAMLNQRDAELVKRIPRIMVDKQRRNALSGAF